jgi:hypothetical protein
MLYEPINCYLWGRRNHIILIIILYALSTCFKDQLLIGGDVLSEKRSRRESNISVPEPEMTKDNKFRCPLDQAVYDNRKDYDRHCKEEHDVL